MSNAVSDYAAMDYREFFELATGLTPYPFQELIGNKLLETSVLSVPTGCGKTQAVVVGWLWRLLRFGDVPRRLVFCLPGRVLTEQTRRVADGCIAKLGINTRVNVFTMMGGKVESEWMDHPEKDCILIGTQDILLSRALNRGYAMSPYRWPVAFGLLNNDVYWVFDEVQLFGDGLATTTQLDGMRRKFETAAPHHSLWMSATLDENRFKTVDFDFDSALAQRQELTAEDRSNNDLRMRLQAKKRLAEAPASCSSAAGAAEFSRAHHQAGTDTLIIANTVRRAREIFGALSGSKGGVKKRSKSVETAPETQPEIWLLHSRFRAMDRKKWTAVFESKPGALGRIIVATQVIEAGLDLDARVMVTDAAPFSSLVQRFGRVNRAGLADDSEIYWVRRPTSSKNEKAAAKSELSDKEREELARPYAVAEVDRAISILVGLTSAGLEDLPCEYDPIVPRHVLRKRDVLDLFDTAPDLAGNDLDISRFVREGSDHDVFVGWRDWELSEGDPPIGLPELDTGELCPVPIGDMKQFLPKGEKGNRRGWTWRLGTVQEADGKRTREKWERVEPEDIFPGQVILLHCAAGGYTPDGGWNPEETSKVDAEEAGGESTESSADDRSSFPRLKYRQSLHAHTDRVYEKLVDLLGAFNNPGLDAMRDDLLGAARHHDWGKAHRVFQKTLGNDGSGPLLAKQIGSGRHERPHFRHELASALAVLNSGASNLAAYLTASHHGRVRLHLRPVPGEHKFVLGVGDGDLLLAADLGDGVGYPQTAVSLAAMEMGADGNGVGSWSDRMLGLVERLGPFRLAYLEAIFRAADCQASADPGDDCEKGEIANA